MEREIDPVIAWYMRDVDRDQLRANLLLTVSERIEKLQRNSYLRESYLAAQAACGVPRRLPRELTDWGESL